MAVPEISTRAELLDILLQHQKDKPDLPVNLAAIARRFGISRQAVHQLYHQLATEHHLPPNLQAYWHVLDERLRPQVKALLEQGLTYEQITQRLDAPPMTIKRIGWELRQSEDVVPNRPRLERREAVRRMRLEGLDNPTIAARLGLSKSQVSYLVCAMMNSGEVPRRRRRRRNPEELATLDAQVQALQKQGMTYPDIAAALQINYTTVVNAMYRLRRRGAIAVRHQHMTRADYQAMLARVEALLDEGMSQAQIAQALGLNYDRTNRAISTVLKRREHGNGSTGDTS